MAATRASTSVACTLCGKTLSRKADLPRHMRTHAPNKEELMYPCPYTDCDYRGLQRSNVVTHMNTHTGERPNKCTTTGCDYATSDPGSLTRHRKAMHGYEPKANPVVRPSNAARKAARRQRRASPYTTSSSSSSSSASSPAPSSDCYDVVDGTLSESAQMSNCSSPPPSPSNVKNASPAYLTALIPELPEPSTSTPPPAPPTQDIDELLTWNSELEPSEEMKRMLAYLQSQCLPLSSSIVSSPELQPVHYVNDPFQPPCPVSLSAMDLSTAAPLTEEDSSVILDTFLSQFMDWNTAVACFPPLPLPFPLYATQPPMSMDNTALYSYAYPSDGLFHNPQLSQPEPSYAMPVPDFCDPVDWSSFETASYGADAFFANQVFVC